MDKLTITHTLDDKSLVSIVLTNTGDTDIVLHRVVPDETNRFKVSPPTSCVWCDGDHAPAECLSDPAHSATPHPNYLNRTR